uniref:ATP synthase complex subunit 8 n=1 Tax=Kallimoides rumia TaxID=311108 RepID=A0A7G9AC16_9NEOP|nr:ATP synthase F0 subunit 8 [Kallimoides rumia]QNL34322.1 ATP synthase F0 subunit 8 [Kallimoides rumia]USF18070.1 ATP synthase F0 subunit 8 [Kallimoides rumia]
MPQMMPINWLFFFFFFIIIFLIFISLNFFIFNYKLIKLNNKKIIKISSNQSWKW